MNAVIQQSMSWLPKLSYSACGMNLQAVKSSLVALHNGFYPSPHLLVETLQDVATTSDRTHEASLIEQFEDISLHPEQSGRGNSPEDLAAEGDAEAVRRFQTREEAVTKLSGGCLRISEEVVWKKKKLFP